MGKVKKIVGGGVLALFGMAACQAAAQSGDGEKSPTLAEARQTTVVTSTVQAPAPEPATSDAPSSAAEAPASTAAEPVGIPGDGTYEVGVDIEPGTYASGVPSSGNCYWARLKTQDSVEGIIANNNSAGQSVVTIKATDKYFQSSGCADWKPRKRR